MSVQKFDEYYLRESNEENSLEVNGVLYLVHFTENGEYQFIPKSSDDLSKIQGKDTQAIEKLLRGKTGMIWTYTLSDAAGLVFKNINFSRDMVTMAIY